MHDTYPEREMTRIMNWRRLAAALAICLAPSAEAQTSDAAHAPAMACANLVGLKIPGISIVIDKATAVPESPPNTVQWMPPAPMTVGVVIPSYCRAEGTVDKRIGVGGKPYALGRRHRPRFPRPLAPALRLAAARLEQGFRQ
jgi:hypothetical protein